MDRRVIGSEFHIAGPDTEKARVPNCVLVRWMMAALFVDDRLNRQDHVTATLQQLHWRPIELRVGYKLCVMMHSIGVTIHYHRCPSCLASVVSTAADQSTRPGLRSAQTARYFIPRGETHGERAVFMLWSYSIFIAEKTILVARNRDQGAESTLHGG